MNRSWRTLLHKFEELVERVWCLARHDADWMCEEIVDILV